MAHGRHRVDEGGQIYWISDELAELVELVELENRMFSANQLRTGPPNVRRLYAESHDDRDGEEARSQPDYGGEKDWPEMNLCRLRAASDFESNGSAITLTLGWCWIDVDFRDFARV